MKLTCSCGASGEFRDNFAGTVNATKWQERHLGCLRAKPTVTLPPLQDERIWSLWHSVAEEEADEVRVDTILAFARAVLRAAGVEVKP